MVGMGGGVDNEPKNAVDSGGRFALYQVRQY